MIHPLRTWKTFFFTRISARPLGMIRICYGLLALFNLAFCAVELDYWYTDTGLLQGDEAQIAAGPFVQSPLHYLQSPTAIRVAFGFTALAAVGLTVGWRTKLMSILFYAGTLSIHNRNTVSSSGADVLFLIYAFYMMLSDCGAAYSIDSWLARRRRGTVAEPLVLAWPVRLFQIQISLVYALAAILKCGGSLWVNGSAIHYVLNNVEVRRLDLSFLSQYPILINLMTYGALAMEFTLAFGLWFRASRPTAICCGIMLHVGILATVNIPVFGELMWIGYLAFLTPPEFAALTRACDIRCWFGAKQREVTVGPLTASTSELALPPAPLMAAATTDAVDEFDFAAKFDLDSLPFVPVGSTSAPSRTIRVDGPEPLIPAPHLPQTEPADRPRTEPDLVEATLDPWDSFQILL